MTPTKNFDNRFKERNKEKRLKKESEWKLGNAGAPEESYGGRNGVVTGQPVSIDYRLYEILNISYE